MKKLIIISFLFFASISLMAQNKSISGKIVSGKKPLLFSNIILKAQKDTLSAVKIVVSDSVGNFKIEDLNNDSYVINIEHLGYLTKIVSIKIDNSKTNFDLNEINLIAESTTLETVKIVSNRKLIKKTTQGFIIKAKDNIAQAGGTATDLLRNTPTVVVDPEGAISIRGKKPLILINNRRSSLSNTDRIPASSIESIEIINNPSAQYDADSEGGIINIKLKKNTANGTNGSLALGAGLGAKGRANSSFIINHSNKKWNFGLGYDNRFAARTRKADSKRINFLQPNDYYVDQFRNDDRFEITQNLKLNIDYALNDKNNFGIEIIANRNGEDNNETQNSTVKNQNNVFNYNNSRFSNELARENGIETNLNYTRKFDNTRKMLTVNFTSILDFDTENTNIDVTNFDSAGQISGNKTFEKTHNYSNGKEYTLQFDYSFPISKNGTIDTGFKSIFRKTSADFVAENFVNTSYVINPLASNTFNFAEQIHASYVQFRSYIGDEQSTKFKYDFGLRIEKVTNENQPTAT
ncbi:MAG: outer membrane beta-barrel protein, partial [Flavobacterium sp.]|nr:outer membrane beta-barrel protein [Flavobacterium sp.]